MPDPPSPLHRQGLIFMQFVPNSVCVSVCACVHVRARVCIVYHNFVMHVFQSASTTPSRAYRKAELICSILLRSTTAKVWKHSSQAEKRERCVTMVTTPNKMNIYGSLFEQVKSARRSIVIDHYTGLTTKSFCLHKKIISLVNTRVAIVKRRFFSPFSNLKSCLLKLGVNLNKSLQFVFLPVSVKRQPFAARLVRGQEEFPGTK